MNSWQLVSVQSKLNKSGYSCDSLATQNWAWPQKTWFQKRLAQLRKKRRQTPAATNAEVVRRESVQASEWS